MVPKDLFTSFAKLVVGLSLSTLYSIRERANSVYPVSLENSKTLVLPVSDCVSLVLATFTKQTIRMDMVSLVWPRRRFLTVSVKLIGSCLFLLIPQTSGWSGGERYAAVASIGERIQKVTLSSSSSSSSASIAATSDLLNIGQDLWLPTDPDLPTHLRFQQVHHEKRQRWSAQLLSKLSGCGVAWNLADWNDERLTRILCAASIPFQCDRPSKEGRSVKEALMGVYGLLCQTSIKDRQHLCLPPALIVGIQQLMHRADAMASEYPLPDAIEARWACRGIQSRVANLPINRDLTFPNLDYRTQQLPFDIFPSGVDWGRLFPGEDVLSKLHSEIPFSFDTITTRTGTAVMERRGTAWVAEEGIGALAYSGKLMNPHPLPTVVQSVMRQVESVISVPLGDSPSTSATRPYFDCALCNYYPDGESACKFHADPEHGTHWERLNCVVAVGDARRFAFRPIPGVSTWESWDSKVVATDSHVPVSFTLYPGDIVSMWGVCNDEFHHAVYPGSGQASLGRISLVLKRAIPRSNGKRGHSLVGQGRRTRRQDSDSPRERSSRKTDSTSIRMQSSLKRV